MASQGFTATTLDNETINIPPATDFWVQSERGTVLPPPVVSSCMLIKLAENHVAVDFLILDATAIGVSSRKPFFIQVSAREYQDRSGGKYAVVQRPSQHTNGISPWEYYTSKLNAEHSYYVYASPAESDFHKDRKEVYLIDL